MPTEIEAKFLDVSHDAVRAKLKAVGARLTHPMRLMRRDLLDFPDKRFQTSPANGRLRIRDEGDKLTITFKKRPSDGKQYSHEWETTIGSYNAMKDLLLAMGLHAYSYQESKRETWQLDNVEVVLDEWPWLKPYIEIEGPSEESIQAVATKLGLNWTDAKFGSVETAYRAQYPGMTEDDTIGGVSEVRFGAPLPDYLKERIQ